MNYSSIAPRDRELLDRNIGWMKFMSTEDRVNFVVCFSASLILGAEIRHALQYRRLSSLSWTDKSFRIGPVLLVHLLLELSTLHKYLLLLMQHSSSIGILLSLLCIYTGTRVIEILLHRQRQEPSAFRTDKNVRCLLVFSPSCFFGASTTLILLYLQSLSSFLRTINLTIALWLIVPLLYFWNGKIGRSCSLYLLIAGYLYTSHDIITSSLLACLTTLLDRIPTPRLRHLLPYWADVDNDTTPTYPEIDAQGDRNPVPPASQEPTC